MSATAWFDRLDPADCTDERLVDGDLSELRRAEPLMIDKLELELLMALTEIDDDGLGKLDPAHWMQSDTAVWGGLLVMSTANIAGSLLVSGWLRRWLVDQGADVLDDYEVDVGVPNDDACRQTAEALASYAAFLEAALDAGDYVVASIG